MKPWTPVNIIVTKKQLQKEWTNIRIRLQNVYFPIELELCWVICDNTVDNTAHVHCLVCLITKHRTLVFNSCQYILFYYLKNLFICIQKWQSSSLYTSYKLFMMRNETKKYRIGQNTERKIRLEKVRCSILRSILWYFSLIRGYTIFFLVFLSFKRFEILFTP